MPYRLNYKLYIKIDSLSYYKLLSFLKKISNLFIIIHFDKNIKYYLIYCKINDINNLNIINNNNIYNQKCNKFLYKLLFKYYKLYNNTLEYLFIDNHILNILNINIFNNLDFHDYLNIFNFNIKIKNILNNYIKHHTQFIFQITHTDINYLLFIKNLILNYKKRKIYIILNNLNYKKFKLLYIDKKNYFKYKYIILLNNVDYYLNTSVINTLFNYKNINNNKVNILILSTYYNKNSNITNYRFKKLFY